MTFPRWASVAALYALQNSMMLTPCWPSAGPIGGAGLAAPAWICSLMRPVTFFLGANVGPSLKYVLGHRSVPQVGGRHGEATGRFVAAKRAATERILWVLLDLGDLVERQGDRGLALEDGYQH